MLKNAVQCCRLDYLAQNLAKESSMHGDGTWDCIKGGQFLESLSNYQLLRRDCSV
jgi:hypothetical protein